MDRNFDVARNLFSFAAVNASAPDWVQLTPVSVGTFVTQDGRKFTIKSADEIIRTSLASGPIGADYDHATDFVMSSASGVQAPAAGWFEELCAHGPGNEPGIWGRPKWTPTGAKKISDGEYRYVSPVLLSKKGTDELLAIVRVALTNGPALVMKGLFSLQETDTVNRKALCGALGIAETSTDDQITAAISKSGADVRSKIAGALGMPETATTDELCSAVKKVGVKASTLANVARVLQAAGITGEDLDETTTTALCAKLKGSAATTTGGKDVATLQGEVDSLQLQLASLTTRLNGSDATAMVDKAIAIGKIPPAQRQWFIDYCTREPKGFESYLAKAPTILPGGRVAFDDATVADGALSETEKQLCAKLGLPEDTYKAQRTADRAKSARTAA